MSNDNDASEGKYMVCPDCGGEGKHVLHGMAFTSSDIEEAGGDEFVEDMLSGMYDTVCETCGGQRVILKSERQDYYDRLQEAHVMRMESGYY